MKANSACKIIGYALEDANVGDLKAKSAVLDTCLSELEQAPRSAAPRDVVLFGALLVVGVVVGRQVNKRGSQ